MLNEWEGKTTAMSSGPSSQNSLNIFPKKQSPGLEKDYSLIPAWKQNIYILETSKTNDSRFSL
jgi:hypothetical protein